MSLKKVKLRFFKIQSIFPSVLVIEMSIPNPKDTYVYYVYIYIFIYIYIIYIYIYTHICIYIFHLFFTVVNNSHIVQAPDTR